jgi:hypothetical protein
MSNRGSTILTKFNIILIAVSCLILSVSSYVDSACEIGAFVGNDNGIPPTAGEVMAFESLAQRHLSSVQVFWTFAEGDFPAEQLTDGVIYHDGYDTKSSLQLTWEPWSRLGGNDNSYTLDSIINGDHDDYISKFARDCRDWDRPVRLRFAHEMITPPGSQEWYPWQNKPTQYTQAWSRIHQIFQSQGATNVEFVWAPLSYPADTATLSQYFPGKDKVDWLGMGGHNHGEDGEPGFPYWQNIDDIFYNLYHTLVENPDVFGDKQIMIAEFSSAEINALDSRTKAEWLLEAFLKIQYEYPEIDAFYWFNTIKGRDWRINSSEETLAAFQQMMDDEYYTSHPVPEASSISLLATGLLTFYFSFLRTKRKM